ncbi:MAG: DUF2970 domain-containing protein [Ketobacter sp.]|nr:DUF2970 domain-containing protein [Ketobacter sp.]
MTEKPDNSTGAPDSNSADRGFWGLVQSTLAAIFGIQSDKNRQQDFKKGDASQFITMGIIAVVGIVITMILVVNSVLDSAAK